MTNPYQALEEDFGIETKISESQKTITRRFNSDLERKIAEAEEENEEVIRKLLQEDL